MVCTAGLHGSATGLQAGLPTTGWMLLPITAVYYWSTSGLPLVCYWSAALVCYWFAWLTCPRKLKRLASHQAGPRRVSTEANGETKLGLPQDSYAPTTSGWLITITFGGLITVDYSWLHFDYIWLHVDCDDYIWLHLITVDYSWLQLITVDYISVYIVQLARIPNKPVNTYRQHLESRLNIPFLPLSIY
jgi:hypothetical protein